MDAGMVISELRRQYGNILKTIKQAESFERAIKQGAPAIVIEKKRASLKQAAMKSGPIQYSGGTGITMGKRA